MPTLKSKGGLLFEIIISFIPHPCLRVAVDLGERGFERCKKVWESCAGCGFVPGGEGGKERGGGGCGTDEVNGRHVCTRQGAKAKGYNGFVIMSGERILIDRNVGVLISLPQNVFGDRGCDFFKARKVSVPSRANGVLFVSFP